MSQYSTGLVSTTNGSSVITGTSTAWLTSGIDASDFFIAAGDTVAYTIASIDSDTQITLTANYAGSTQSGITYTAHIERFGALPIFSDNDADTPELMNEVVKFTVNQDSALGTASTKDTGTAAGEVPLSPATTTITASATFTQSTNNIALVGLGSIGLEIGDVNEVTGTDDNDKLFTVEVITDADNVIVNQAHAGGTTTKSLVDETVSATVTLVAKWFNASLGLGQGWLLVTASRASGTTYTNSTNRALMVSEYNGGDTSANLTIDGIRVEFSIDFATGNNSSVQGVVPINGEYSITLTIPGGIDEWAELR